MTVLCRKCKVEMEVGTAIPTAYTVQEDGRGISQTHWHNIAPLVDVWKCPKCGRSIRKSELEKMRINS